MHETGELVRQYRIIRRVGRGGMGEVYEAEDETLRRRVALKTIRAAQRPSEHGQARFLREARILSQLDHPGICRIHDYVEGEDRDHLVLEFIRGRTLTDLDFPIPQRLELIEQLLAVMVVAHENDIIHRDLKPENIMVTDEGLLKVLDFGLARPAPAGGDGTVTRGSDSAADGETLDTTLTFGRGVVGTPAYMSPEQASGEPATPASDMYSCGLVIHFLLTGRPAYGPTRDLVHLLDQARRAAVVPIDDGDPDLAALVAQLTCRSPGARPTAAAALQRLRWIRRKPARRSRRLLVVAIALAAGLSAVKYTADLHRERGRAEVQRTKAEELLGFMLGDLKLKLEKVGRLDIMDGVGDQATAYFADRNPDELRDAEAQRYIRTLNLIGGIRLERGHPDSARVAYGQALVLARQEAARRPSDAAAQSLLGDTEFYMGSVAYGEGDLDRAEGHFLAYHRVAREMLGRDPDNGKWRQELAYAQTSLAQLYRERGQRGQALVVLHESLATKRELLAADPDNPDLMSSLANSQAIVALTLAEDHRLSESADNYRAARQMAEAALAADPDHAELMSRLSTLLQREGLAAMRLGQVATARSLFARDLVLAQGLVERDPDNTVWRTGLAYSLASAADAAIAAGDPVGAAKFRSQWNSLRKLGPTAEGREAFALGALVFANLDFVNGQPENALAALKDVISASRSWGEISPSERVVRLRALVLALEVAQAAPDLVAESQSWSHSFDTEYRSDPEIDRSLAALMSRVRWARLTGNEAEATTIAQRLTGWGCAHPVLLEDVRALGAPIGGESE